MGTAKKMAIGLFIIFAGVQFIQPDFNNSDRIVTVDITTDTFGIPPRITRIIRRSCYDCHSNHTEYPWYSYIQPMGWIINRHIREGKKILNFSEFMSYPARKQAGKWKIIKSQIVQNKMPLPSYELIHKDAMLTNEEKILIITFVNNLTL